MSTPILVRPAQRRPGGGNGFSTTAPTSATVTLLAAGQVLARVHRGRRPRPDRGFRRGKQQRRGPIARGSCPFAAACTTSAVKRGVNRAPARKRIKTAPMIALLAIGKAVLYSGLRVQARRGTPWHGRGREFESHRLHFNENAVNPRVCGVFHWAGTKGADPP